MEKLDKFVELRRKYVSLYNEAFSKLEQIKTPYQAPEGNSSWHLYIIRLDLEKLTVGQKEIFEALQKENIGVNVHYIPVYYQQLGYQKGLCDNAEQLYEKIISLPLFPAMNEQDINDVISAVEKVISLYSKKRVIR